jgi:hypothetical protein
MSLSPKPLPLLRSTGSGTRLSTMLSPRKKEEPLGRIVAPKEGSDGEKWVHDLQYLEMLFPRVPSAMLSCLLRREGGSMQAVLCGLVERGWEAAALDVHYATPYYFGALGLDCLRLLEGAEEGAFLTGWSGRGRAGYFVLFVPPASSGARGPARRWLSPQGPEVPAKLRRKLRLGRPLVRPGLRWACRLCGGEVGPCLQLPPPTRPFPQSLREAAVADLEATALLLSPLYLSCSSPSPSPCRSSRSSRSSRSMDRKGSAPSLSSPSSSSSADSSPPASPSSRRALARSGSDVAVRHCNSPSPFVVHIPPPQK